MNLRLAFIISLIAGFVSISMEIIWFSIFGYMFKGHAFTFSVVLSLVLIGIALGAKYGYKAIKNPNINAVRLISNCLFIAGVSSFLGFPFVAWLMTIHSAFAALMVVNVVAISSLLGCIFPLLCHISVSSKEQNVGKQTSLLYAANIIGATTGPLVTGYILFDYFAPEDIIIGLCILLLILSLVLRIYAFSLKQNYRNVFISLLLIFVAIVFQKSLYNNFLAHIHYQSEFDKSKTFKYIDHSRSGTVTVDQEDRFFGGGAYDGAINTDPSVYNINAIDRAYMVAALHKAPEKVLMIGLSSGSWAKVLSDYDLVKEITIVEINPGYLKLISKYPEIAEILNDKKVKIIIDDGRRWMKKNPDKKFDLIVMNTMYYWRQNSTNLYSIEFLTMAKKLLNENGVFYANTTRCADAIYTTAHIFSHIKTYGTFVAGSDKPFNMTREEIVNNFLKFHRKGEALFTQQYFINRYNEMLDIPMPDIHDSILKEDLWLITDNNMASEYKVDVWNIFSKLK